MLHGGVRTEAELFAVAWAVTRDLDSAVTAVRVGRDAANAGPTGPALTRPDRASLIAAVVVAAIDLAPATAVLPLGLLEAAMGDDESLDLVALATGATGVLEPRDRAVLELTLRHGLEGVELARALDRVPGTLAAEMEAAREHAEHLVGSALFARLARADCEGLDSSLAGLATDPDAVDVADRVAAHVLDCPTCADRRRALVPVASLLAGAEPPEPPAALDIAPAGSRKRRARRRLPRLRLRSRPWKPVLATALVIGTATVLVLMLSTRTTARGETTRRAGLGSDTVSIDLGRQITSARLTIRNGADRPVRYQVHTGAAWLTVSPAAGRLAAGATSELSVTLDRAGAPEGPVRAEVRVTSTLGNAAVPVSAVVERAPALGAATTSPDSLPATSCTAPIATTVSVPVVDESGLGSVTLHWKTDTASGTVPMAASGTTERATLGPFASAGAVTWWIVATDVRGNTAVSAPQQLVVTGC